MATKVKKTAVGASVKSKTASAPKKTATKAQKKTASKLTTKAVAKGALDIAAAVGVPGASLGSAALGLIPDKKSGGIGHRSRRMNYGNTKALNKAERRLKGFVKVARKALRHSGYTVVSKSKVRSPGVVTKSELKRAMAQ